MDHREHLNSVSDREEERERLTKIWKSKTKQFEGKTVECTIDVNIYQLKIKKGDRHVVKEVHMYLGCVPSLEFEELPKKLWSCDKFKVIEA